jgi:hypothetical protein
MHISAQILPGGRADELAVLDAFGANQPFSDLPNLPGIPLDDHCFKTVVRIEVNVGRADNLRMMIVLQSSERFREVVRVMIIDDRNRPDDFGVLSLPLALNDVVPNDIPKRLRPAGISSSRNQLIEHPQELWVHRHPKPFNRLHAASTVLRTYIIVAPEQQSVNRHPLTHHVFEV